MDPVTENVGQVGVRRAALTSLASYGIPVLIGLVAMPIAFRLLGASLFGVLSIALLAPALATSLDFGASSAATRRFAEAFERDPRSFGTAVGSYSLVLAGIGVVLGALVFLLAPNLVKWLGFAEVMDERTGTDLIRLCALWMCLSLALATPAIILRAKQRFGELTIIQSASTLALWTAVIVLAATRSGLFWTVALAILTTTLSALACFALARREMPEGSRLGFDAAMIVADSRFASGLFMLQLSNVVAFQLDRVIVAALASPAAAGVYALCVAVANKSLFAISALTSFAFPRVAAMRGREQNAEIGSFLQAVLRVALVLVAPIILPALFLSGPFLALWLGSTIDNQAVRLLQLLWVGYAITAVCAPATHVFTGTGTSRLAATFAWITAILLVSGMLLLVPRLGLIGAGLANVIALSSSFVFVAIVRRRLAAPADPTKRRLLAGIGAGVLSQLAVLAVMSPLVNSWALFLLTGIASLAAFQLVRWALRSFAGEELRLIDSIALRLRRSNPWAR